MRVSDFGYLEDLHLVRRKTGEGGHFLVERDYRCAFRLDSRDIIYTVPAGTKTDLASIPRFAQGIVEKLGAHIEAAVVHDRLCIDKGVIRPDLILTSEEAADVFNEAMKTARVPDDTRDLMYCAVLWFGPRWG